MNRDTLNHPVSKLDTSVVGTVDDNSPIALLYDHSKHLLSLSLLGIGGIMTLTQSSVGERIESIITAMLIMLFAGSGLCSLSVAAAILRAAKSNELPGRSAWMLNQGAMGLLGAGVAVFLISWIRVII
jgi:hypothetical protein